MAMQDIDLTVSSPMMSIPGAVIDSYAKSGLPGSAARADSLLAKMIHLHQMDPVNNADLCPNTYVFNTGQYIID